MADGKISYGRGNRLTLCRVFNLVLNQVFFSFFLNENTEMHRLEVRFWRIVHSVSWPETGTPIGYFHCFRVFCMIC